jgi:hypothetical protein
MHETTTKEQTQSYVSVIRPEKKSVLNHEVNEIEQQKKPIKDLLGNNKKKSSINIKVNIWGLINITMYQNWKFLLIISRFKKKLKTLDE